MLIKLLFLAVILYFVLKTARSLINAVRGDVSRQALDEEAPLRRPEKKRENVEDARYVDL